MIGDIITNKAGVEQLDGKGKPLRVGQPVLIMDTVYSKGGRGSVSFGTVVGFERYALVERGLLNEHSINQYDQFYADVKAKRIKLNDWDERRARSIGSPSGISPIYLIGCTKEFIHGWEDGTIFD